MNVVPRTLVIGATGMLGRALVTECKRRGEVAVSMARSGADLNINVHDDNALARIFQDVRPDVVINCAALTSVDVCENDPSGAYLINARAVGIMTELANRNRAYLVQISTDHFFSGDEGRKHDEAAPVRLVNEYARTKYAGERFALTSPDALVIRTNIVGFRGLAGKPTFVEWVFDTLSTGRPMVLFSDFFTSSIDVGQFSTALFDLLPARPVGVLNLASADVASKKTFIESLAAAANLDTARCQTASFRSKAGAPRAESLGLDVSRAEGLLGRPLPGMDSVIKNLINEYSGQS